ncbi:hypothetical protein GCM10011594_27840 [Nakamurella endophytica]|uniref:Uncharacterized protein n=1 Tax=Nakamurella endophytica TaxID=1748367 RepID=A0A917T0Q7_9ACTN|nr:hypothetical protein GCM10011594_27840 [Nakamurella endophytica]
MSADLRGSGGVAPAEVAAGRWGTVIPGPPGILPDRLRPAPGAAYRQGRGAYRHGHGESRGGGQGHRKTCPA